MWVSGVFCSRWRSGGNHSGLGLTALWDFFIFVKHRRYTLRFDLRKVVFAPSGSNNIISKLWSPVRSSRWMFGDRPDKVRYILHFSLSRFKLLRRYFASAAGLELGSYNWPTYTCSQINLLLLGLKSMRWEPRGPIFSFENVIRLTFKDQTFSEGSVAIFPILPFNKFTARI